MLANAFATTPPLWSRLHDDPSAAISIAVKPAGSGTVEVFATVDVMVNVEVGVVHTALVEVSVSIAVIVKTDA